MWGVWGQRQLMQEGVRFSQPLQVSFPGSSVPGKRAEQALESHLPMFNCGCYLIPTKY